MSYRFVYDPKAASEYANALEWYRHKSEKAAEGFIAAIKNCILLICSKPARWRKTYGDFREINVNKYPYLIVYYTDESTGTVIIISVHHAKRHPERKYKNQA